jgi:hemin uptake protein HemP
VSCIHYPLAQPHATSQATRAKVFPTVTSNPRPSDSAISPGDDSQPAVGDPQSQRLVDSAQLLQGEQELLIRHGNEVYRLRLTRSGKLILHK